MNSLKDTIAAAATPSGIGGVAVIRISGADSKDILKKVFSKKSGYEHSKMYFGKISDGEDVLDEGYAVFFESPKSYTGEDTAELHVHGGAGVLRILDLLFKSGARQAEPGEFSKRAFINGKIDLTKAQAISDYIAASGELCLKRSMSDINGSLKRLLDKYIYELTDIIAREEAEIEYPDEDDWREGADPNEVLRLSKAVSGLAKSYKTGAYIKNGVKISIAGKPNVGKSSILNALCGERRAIVSDVAGTTRDVITQRTQAGGVIFELSDTAGIRNTEDKIEKIGVEFSEQSVNSADLVLFITDCTRPLDEFDARALKTIKNSQTEYYIVLNKTDCSESVLTKADIEKFDNAHIIEMSAKSADDIERLKRELVNYALKDYNADSAVVLNLRQAQLLDEASGQLINAYNALINGLDLDCALTDLKDALYSLGEITGDCVSEEVVNRVFEKFCLGK